MFPIFHNKTGKVRDDLNESELAELAALPASKQQIIADLQRCGRDGEESEATLRAANIALADAMKARNLAQSEHTQNLPKLSHHTLWLKTVKGIDPPVDAAMVERGKITKAELDAREEALSIARDNADLALASAKAARAITATALDRFQKAFQAAIPTRNDLLKQLHNVSPRPRRVANTAVDMEAAHGRSTAPGSASRPRGGYRAYARSNDRYGPRGSRIKLPSQL
jgi:hypothetical protein